MLIDELNNKKLVMCSRATVRKSFLVDGIDKESYPDDMQLYNNIIGHATLYTADHTRCFSPLAANEG